MVNDFDDTISGATVHRYHTCNLVSIPWLGDCANGWTLKKLPV